MITALLLSGGTGERFGSNIPKQYVEVSGQPVLVYALEILANHPQIDRIIVVAEEVWQPKIREWARDLRILRPISFAPAGHSRQQSILNGMNAMRTLGAAENDIVVVHDAARPCLPPALLSNCLAALVDVDAVMPVLPMKDTAYFSMDGRQITGLLDRDCLFAGQAPEVFRFGKYYAAHRGMTEEALAAIRGSSELAFQCGMKVRLIPGSEDNYKITTRADMEKFRRQIGGQR